MHLLGVRRRLIRVWPIVLYAAVALVPLSVGLMRPGLTPSPRVLPQDMVYGQAHRPFVKRQLVPSIVRVGTAAMPDGLRESLEASFEASPWVRRMGWPNAFATEYALIVAFMYLCLIGFLSQLQRFLRQCLQVSSRFAHGVVVLVGLGLPICYKAIFQIYDFAQLFLFTSCLLLMLRGRWGLYYLVFLLACVNKETSLLLPVILGAWLGRRCMERRWLLHLGSQLAIGLAIALALAWRYRDNPGTDLEWHLFHNLTLSWNALGWLRLSILCLAVPLALWQARRASRFLRSGFIVTFAPLLSLTLFFGLVDELRDYFEALPFTVALILLLFGIKARDVEPVWSDRPAAE